MKLTTTIASAAVAGVLGLAGVSVAGAAATGSSGAPTTPSTSTTPTTAPNASGGTKTPAAAPGARANRAARRRRRRRQIALIAAHTIGITPRALAQEVRAGKTIAQVATEHGVRPQAVIDALEAAATKRIDAARDAGKITAERAARMQQRADVAIPRIVNEWHPRARKSG